MTRITLSFSFALLFFFGAFAQDKTFENPNQTLINLNPSFAGSNGLFRSQSFYGRSYLSYKAAPYSCYNAVDFYAKAIGGGMSLSTTFESRGPVNTTGLNLGYARYFIRGKLKLIPSIQFRYTRRMISQEWIIPTPNTRNEKRITDFLNLNTGILVNYDAFYIGLSLLHPRGLSNQNILPQRNNRVKSNFYASYNYKINSKNTIHFSLIHSTYISPYDFRLTATATLFSHLIIGSGLDINLNYLGIVGYRNRYFTLQSGYTTLTIYSGGNLFASVSVNLRTKETNKEPTNLEAW